jgi:hypothetical protein
MKAQRIFADDTDPEQATVRTEADSFAALYRLYRLTDKERGIDKQEVPDERATHPGLDS